MVVGPDVIIVRFAAALNHRDVILHQHLAVVFCEIAIVKRVPIALTIDLNRIVSKFLGKVVRGPKSESLPVPHKTPDHDGPICKVIMPEKISRGNALYFVKAREAERLLELSGKRVKI